MLKELSGIGFDEKVYLLALSVIRERIKAIPPADREDLFVLLREFLTAENDDARESAALAITEIIEPSPGGVLRGNLADEPPGQWMAFISRRVRELRKQAGITQEELARRSGLTKSYLSGVEKGKHSPTGLALERIATALSVPMSKLEPDTAAEFSEPAEPN